MSIVKLGKTELKHETFISVTLMHKKSKIQYWEGWSI